MKMMKTRSSLSIPAVRVVTNEEARSPLLATAIAQPSYEEDYDGDHDDHEDSILLIVVIMRIAIW